MIFDNLDASQYSPNLAFLAKIANTAPSCTNPQSGFTNEDTGLNGSVTCSDAESNPLTYSRVVNATHGSVTVNANGSFTYTPTANYNGSDSFTFKANDGSADSNVATFNITVTAVNDEPSFTKGANQTVSEDAAAQTVTGWATAISAGPADESSQVLTFHATNDNNGLFSSQPTVAANGTLTYTPAVNANGSATVSVFLTDNGGVANGGDDTSPTQTFTITVNAVNDAPSCANDSGSTAEDTALSGNLSCTDVDSISLAIAYSLGGNYNFQVDVTDNSEPGSSPGAGPDTYAIRVWDTTTGTYYQLATPTAQQKIDGGNIQVRP